MPSRTGSGGVPRAGAVIALHRMQRGRRRARAVVDAHRRRSAPSAPTARSPPSSRPTHQRVGRIRVRRVQRGAASSTSRASWRTATSQAWSEDAAGSSQSALRRQGGECRTREARDAQRRERLQSVANTTPRGGSTRRPSRITPFAGPGACTGVAAPCSGSVHSTSACRQVERHQHGCARRRRARKHSTGSGASRKRMLALHQRRLRLAPAQERARGVEHRIRRRASCAVTLRARCASATGSHGVPSLKPAVRRRRSTASACGNRRGP